jgi:hypothetical protein
MTETRADGVLEFRRWVLEAYRPLLDSGCLVELPRPDDAERNAFSVRLGNTTTVIEVQGINYGAAAWTKVLRACDADSDYYGFPIYQLLADRNPGRRAARKKRPAGQHADIFRDAADIIEHAQDVLQGDFTALETIVEQRNREEKERLARAPSPQQRKANTACSAAGHAFKRGDYNEVVRLLEPHLELISAAQRRRYELACQRAKADGCDSPVGNDS